MPLAAHLLAALLAAPPTPPALPSQAPPESGPPDARAATLVVRARGVDEAQLQAALRPRSGGAPVVLLRDVARVDPDHTFVDVDLQPPELTITIILRDGRVFVRRAAADSPREAARLIASMLAAIADDALAPLPERATSPALAEVSSGHAPMDMPEAPGDPAPLAVPVPPEPAPVTSPSGHVLKSMPEEIDPLAVVEPAPARPPAPAAAVARPLHLELGLAGAPLFGLGLPDAGLRGGSGEVRLDLRGPQIWLVGLGVRAAGQTRGGPERESQFGLARVRVSLGAGAWLRRGRFELRAAANFTVEPWLVTHSGRRVRPGESVEPAPLLGGLIRIAPSFLVANSVQIGVFAELAASAAPTGNAVRIGVPERTLFTLGGLESSIGLELRARLWSKPTKRR